MTAVDEQTIQSVIDKVASDNDPGTDPEETEVVTEMDPNGDPNAGDDLSHTDENGSDEETKSEEDAKATQAFAAMRVANKELNQTVEQLKAEIAALKGESSDGEQEKSDQPDQPDPLAIKETDSEEVKALKAMVSELKKDTDTLKQDRTQRLNQEQEARMIGELTGLRDKYSLDQAKLLQFADDAEKAGFILGQTPLTVEQVYTLIYHNQLVENAVKAVENATNDGVSPATGPGATGGTGGKTSARPAQVVAGIIKDLGLK